VGVAEARGCGRVRRRSGGSGQTADELLCARTQEARGGAGGRQRERCRVAGHGGRWMGDNFLILTLF
jgi:hypothetical protein